MAMGVIEGAGEALDARRLRAGTRSKGGTVGWCVALGARGSEYDPR